MSPTSAAAGATSRGRCCSRPCTRIDLIDAEHLALDAARANVTDPRASFHWLDLTREPAPATYDAIVCNPPFHTGRASTPALGQSMIEAAARALKPGGRFYMVANRGLPYEPLPTSPLRDVATTTSSDGVAEFYLFAEILRRPPTRSGSHINVLSAA